MIPEVVVFAALAAPAQSAAVSYDVPAAANRAYIPFVPNYRQTISESQCAARFGTVSQHGPPLAFSSCNPPGLLPGTVAHQGPNGESGVIYRRGDGFGGGGNTLFIEGGGTDIRTGTAGGTDYNPPGSQDATLATKVRITDTLNSPGVEATVTDFDLAFPIACANDPDPSFGSTCAGLTSTAALLGYVPGPNTVIQLFEVRMKDNGVNGTLGDADDRTFVIQGISIP